MTDRVEHQSAVPAAASAPAAGEASTPAPPGQDAAPAQSTADAPPSSAPQNAEPGEGGGEEEEASKRPSRSQRLQRKVQLLTAELDEMRRQSATVRPQDAGLRHQDAMPHAMPPREADFGDTQAYERALNAWNVELSAERAFQRAAERERLSQQAAREAEVNRERVIAHVERVEELKDRVPDFDDTMKAAAAINLRNEVAQEILGSEKSALIQYHLAKNPDRARELNGLTGRELARAVGRLEGAVRLPPSRKATDATPPLAPLRGAAALSFDPAKAEMDEYVASFAERRKRRLAGR
jgi:hypothetical protein